MAERFGGLLDCDYLIIFCEVMVDIIEELNHFTSHVVGLKSFL